jgi:hypothetical protein
MACNSAFNSVVELLSRRRKGTRDTTGCRGEKALQDAASATVTAIVFIDMVKLSLSLSLSLSLALSLSRSCNADLMVVQRKFQFRFPRALLSTRYPVLSAALTSVSVRRDLGTGGSFLRLSV